MSICDDTLAFFGGRRIVPTDNFCAINCPNGGIRLRWFVETTFLQINFNRSLVSYTTREISMCFVLLYYHLFQLNVWILFLTPPSFTFLLCVVAYCWIELCFGCKESMIHGENDFRFHLCNVLLVMCWSNTVLSLIAVGLVSALVMRK